MRKTRILTFFILFFSLLAEARLSSALKNTLDFGWNVGAYYQKDNLNLISQCQKDIQIESIASDSTMLFQKAYTYSELIDVVYSEHIAKHSLGVSKEAVREDLGFFPKAVSKSEKAFYFLAMHEHPYRIFVENCSSVKSSELFINSRIPRSIYIVEIILNDYNERELNSLGISMKDLNFFSFWLMLGKNSKFPRYEINYRLLGSSSSSWLGHIESTKAERLACISGEQKACLLLANKIYEYVFKLSDLSQEPPNRHGASYDKYEVSIHRDASDQEEIQRLDYLLDKLSQLDRKIGVLKTWRDRSFIDSVSLEKYYNEPMKVFDDLRFELSYCIESAESCTHVLDEIESELDQFSGLPNGTISLSSLCGIPQVLGESSLVFMKRFMEKYSITKCDELDQMAAKITYLDLQASGIESILLLEFFPSLKNLNISYNYILDLYPLWQLKNLEILFVKGLPDVDEKTLFEKMDNLEFVFQ